MLTVISLKDSYWYDHYKMLAASQNTRAKSDTLQENIPL